LRKKNFIARNKPRTRRSGQSSPGDWSGYLPGEDRGGYRTRRLVTDRQEKRSRLTRFILTLGLITAAAAFVAAFFIIRAGGSEPVVVEPIVIDDPGSGNVIVMGKDEGGHLTQVLVLAGAGQGGYGLMALPARTVVETPGAGFQRLDKLYEAGGQRQLDQAVANLLQVPIRYHVSFNYEALSALLDQAGVINIKPGKVITLNQSAGGPITLTAGDNPTPPSQAMPILKAAAASPDGPAVTAAFYQGLREALTPKPDLDKKKIASDLLAKSQTDMSADDFTNLFLVVTTPSRAFAATPLPVKAVGSGDSWYFEPSMDELGSVGNGSQEAPVALEIRNGTELSGMVEAANTRLESLNFPTELTPDPSGVNYEITQIRCGSEAVSDGNQVRAALGGGDVIKDDSMEKNQIIVIIGKDLSVALTGQN